MKNIETRGLPLVERLPFLGVYARSRGPSYLFFWAHRISGLMLVLYLLFHVLTLSTLADPARFDAKMGALDAPLFVALEFLLAVPLLFHACNGVRIMLYESFGCRNELHLFNWLGMSGLLYLFLLAFFMASGTQAVTPLVYGLSFLIAGLMLSAYTSQRIWRTHNRPLWKLQRITAAFLLSALPGHMLFMHLNPSLGHEAGIILSRMQLPFLKIFYLLTLGCIVFHATYGLHSLTLDLVNRQSIRTVLTLCLLLFTAFATLLGLRLTLFLA